jgi:hypothetical protein
VTERTCSTCGYWSQWLPNVGDCMAYAEQRREALLASDDRAGFVAQWPPKPARETAPEETCSDWKAPR